MARILRIPLRVVLDALRVVLWTLLFLLGLFMVAALGFVGGIIWIGDRAARAIHL